MSAETNMIPTTLIETTTVSAIIRIQKARKNRPQTAMGVSHGCHGIFPLAEPS